LRSTKERKPNAAAKTKGSKAYQRKHHHQGKAGKRRETHELAEEKRWLVHLFEAERAWAYAMALRKEAASEGEPRKTLHAKRRWKKAVKSAAFLIAAMEQTNHSEALAYHCWMAANLAMEEKQWAKAASLFSKTGYRCKEEGQAFLRYCQHQMERQGIAWDEEASLPLSPSFWWPIPFETEDMAQFFAEELKLPETMTREALEKLNKKISLSWRKTASVKHLLTFLRVRMELSELDQRFKEEFPAEIDPKKLLLCDLDSIKLQRIFWRTGKECLYAANKLKKLADFAKGLELQHEATAVAEQVAGLGSVLRWAGHLRCGREKRPDPKASFPQLSPHQLSKKVFYFPVVPRLNQDNDYVNSQLAILAEAYRTLDGAVFTPFGLKPRDPENVAGVLSMEAIKSVFPLNIDWSKPVIPTDESVLGPMPLKPVFYDLAFDYVRPSPKAEENDTTKEENSSEKLGFLRNFWKK